MVRVIGMNNMVLWMIGRFFFNHRIIFILFLIDWSHTRCYFDISKTQSCRDVHAFLDKISYRDNQLFDCTTCLEVLTVHHNGLRFLHQCISPTLFWCASDIASVVVFLTLDQHSNQSPTRQRVDTLRVRPQSRVRE